MVKYSCKICQKTFTQKGHFERHMSRKRPCKKDNTIEVLVEQKVKEALSKTNLNEIKNESSTEHQNESIQTDYSKKTREELIVICKGKNIRGYSKKKKDDILKLLSGNSDKIDDSQSQTVIPEDTKPNKLNIKMIDLFAGTGAFTLAFQETSFVDIVFGNDMVEYSKKIYDENFNHKLTLKDLNEVKVEDIQAHDILTGGFPCQPFSIAGLREGFNDERSNVFWKILSIIDYHQPKCVILENVKNLISHDENKTFNTIKKNLEERGYFICHKVLNTSNITGIPHHRERIYIV